METYTKKYKIVSSCFAIPLEDHYKFYYIFEHVFIHGLNEMVQC